MNKTILKSLELLKQLAKTVLLNFQSLDRKQLNSIIQGKFYCINDNNYFAEFPEEICIADFEWLCSHEGAVYLTAELSEVTIRKPFCGQFIGLSGKTYLWFQPGNYVDQKQSPLELCSLGSICNTVVVHNIAADRPMIKESYNANTNEGPNFFCTMSAHLMCAGVSDQQSFYYKQGQTGPRSGGLKNLIDVFNFWSVEPWPNVLEHSARRGTSTIAEKKIRNIFYKGSLSDINSFLPELIIYALEDVSKTLSIFKTLHLAWCDSLPSKESQYFYLKRAKVNYSLSFDFKEWFYSTETKYQAIKTEIKELVKANNKSKIDEFLKELNTYVRFRTYSLDELPADFKNKAGTKVLKRYDKAWLLTQELDPVCKSIIYKWNFLYPAVDWSLDETGSPAWYSKCDDSADSPICQLLLDAKIKTESGLYPIKYDKVIKFCYVPKTGPLTKITSPKKGLLTKDNCGSILAKDFIECWENNTFQSDSEVCKKIVHKMSLISYWTSIRSRLAELVVLTPGT